MKGAKGLPGLTVEPLSDAKIDAMLRWIQSALRLERSLPWFKALKPRRFVYACPPSVN